MSVSDKNENPYQSPSPAKKKASLPREGKLGIALIGGAIAAGVLVFGGICTPVGLVMFDQGLQRSFGDAYDPTIPALAGAAVAIVPAIFAAWLVIRLGRRK